MNLTHVNKYWLVLPIGFLEMWQLQMSSLLVHDGSGAKIQRILLITRAIFWPNRQWCLILIVNGTFSSNRYS